MSTSKIVLVGGGTGFIGSCVSQTLTRFGYDVVTISRRAQDQKKCMTWTHIERNGLPNNVTAVINLAGAPVLNPMKRWTNEFKEEVRQSRIGTTKVLRDAIVNADSSPKVFIAVSAIGFYPTHKTEVYDEYSIPKTKDYMSELCVDWENAGMLPESCSTTRHVIVRSGIVLGKQGGILPQMKPLFQMGLGGPIGNGEQWFPWIHIDDMTGIFLHALEDQLVHGVMNGVAPEPRTNKQFADTLASVLRRPAFFRVPDFAMNCLYGSTRASMVLEGQNVYPKRTMEYGYKFKYPTLMEALKNLVT